MSGPAVVEEEGAEQDNLQLWIITKCLILFQPLCPFPSCTSPTITPTHLFSLVWFVFLSFLLSNISFIINEEILNVKSSVERVLLLTRTPILWSDVVLQSSFIHSGGGLKVYSGSHHKRKMEPEVTGASKKILLHFCLFELVSSQTSHKTILSGGRGCQETTSLVNVIPLLCIGWHLRVTLWVTGLFVPHVTDRSFNGKRLVSQRL